MSAMKQTVNEKINYSKIGALSIMVAPAPSPPIETHTWDTIETRTFVYDDWNPTPNDTNLEPQQ